MTSQLNVDTIVDKAGSGGTNIKIGNTATYESVGGSVTQNVSSGMVKGFAFFAQSTTSLSDTFNVASATDSATGTVILNLTNLRSSTLDPYVGNGQGAANTNVVTYECTDNAATNSARYNCTLSGSGDALHDANANTVISGELA